MEVTGLVLGTLPVVLDAMKAVQLRFSPYADSQEAHDFEEQQRRLQHWADATGIADGPEFRDPALKDREVSEGIQELLAIAQSIMEEVTKLMQGLESRRKQLRWALRGDQQIIAKNTQQLMAVVRQLNQLVPVKNDPAFTAMLVLESPMEQVGLSSAKGAKSDELDKRISTAQNHTDKGNQNQLSFIIFVRLEWANFHLSPLSKRLTGLDPRRLYLV